MDNTQTQMEIDVLLLLKKLWQKKFMISLMAIFMASLALSVSLFLLKPVYTSTTKIYVVNQKDNASITTQDLQVGDYLVKDYSEILTSKDVLSTVVEQAGLEMTAEALLAKISVSVPTNTRIISISVNDLDPSEATRLANTIREVGAEKIKQITKVDEVTTLENAEEPTSPSSPNIKRNTILGGLIGGFLATVLVLVRELLDDRVKRPEDVEETLGLPLLGIVPEMSKLK